MTFIILMKDEVEEGEMWRERMCVTVCVCVCVEWYI